MPHEVATPDCPPEIAAQIEGLGKPLSVHHFPKELYLRRIRRIWFILISTSVALILGISHLLWFGPQPQVWFKPFHIVFFQFDFLTFYVALRYLYAMRQSHRFRIQRYETGILSKHGEQVLSFRWDEIVDFQLDLLGSDGKIELKSMATEVAFLVVHSSQSNRLRRFLIPTHRLSYQQMRLVRDDGRETNIPSYFTDFPILLEEVQVRIFNSVWPEIWQRFLAGEEIETKRSYTRLSRRGLTGKYTSIVDTIRVSREGIDFPSFKSGDARFIDWSQIKNVRIGSTIGFDTFSRWKYPSIIGDISWFANPHVFLHLLKEGLQLHRDEMAKKPVEASGPIKA